MKNIVMLLSGLIFMSGSLNATSDNFDIYGVSSELQKQIFSKCKAEIREYNQLSQQIKFPLKLDKRLIKRHEIELSLIKKVNELGDFSMVKISTINYPQDQTIYSTLDIVQKNDSDRLPKSPVQYAKKRIKKPEELNQLFQRWNNYTNRNLALMSQNKFDMKTRSCPVVHCTFGFDKEELKNDLPKFKAGAAKYKNQLIDIIKYGNDDEERGLAILILANINDYHEIFDLMVGLTDDPSDLVRNNAMRVLGVILSKYDIHGLDIRNILLALNYPYTTDRNKAACLILDMVRKDKSIHPLVIKQSGNTLINLLKLKQPNNHDIVYLILKEISHQNYSEHDYQHWQQWVDLENNKLKKS